MKHLKILFVIFMMLLSLTLVACDDPPAEQPKEPTIDEKITAGMTYDEVVEIVGKYGRLSNYVSNIEIWDMGDDLDLYVWFDRAAYSEGAVVTRAECRALFVPSVGMSLSELNDFLGLQGAAYETLPNVYYWDSAAEGDFYAWFDADGKLAKWKVCFLPDLTVGMTLDEVEAFLVSEGTAVPDVYGLYRWTTGKANEYYYVRFVDGKTTEFFYDGEINIELGMTYERLARIYGSGYALTGIGMYSWQTSENNVGFFKFEYVNGAIVLSQFVTDMCDFVGMTLAEINEFIGTSGEKYKDSIYKWDTVFDQDLYVWFDSEFVATNFRYWGDDVDDVEVGMSEADVLLLLGSPTGRTAGRRWSYTDDTEFYLLFDDKTDTLVGKRIIPKTDVYTGMYLEMIREILGSVGWSIGHNTYEWIVGDYYLRVYTDDNGRVFDILFKHI